MCAYIFIYKNVYHQNKKPINKFINQQHKAKINFNKNSDKIGCVEIYVEDLDDFENFVEYMFRKLGKDVIRHIGIHIGYFQDLKEMNIMIPEVHEKMWIEMDRQGRCNTVLANATDYKLIGLLNKYDIYFRYGYDKDNEIDQMFKESMKEKISEYRGINNEMWVIIFYFL
jgi:hypothetical protein